MAKSSHREGSKTHQKTFIRVKVSPNASANQVEGREDGVIRIRLTAPPIEGRANKSLREFLAKRLGTSKGNIEIVSGKQSRLKRVRIQGCSTEDVERCLEKGN
jgi:uncharacterized protein (TIGR00251 family)